MNGVDRAVLRFVLRHRSAGLTSVMRAVTVFGSMAVLVPLAVVIALAWWASGRSWFAARLLGLALGGGWALAQLAKRLLHRTRPPVADHLVRATGLAFPSGHAAQAMAFWGSVAILATLSLKSRSGRIVTCVAALLVVVLVGASRVYLGVHWASDVVGGWMLGAVWLAASRSLALRGATSATGG